MQKFQIIFLSLFITTLLCVSGIPVHAQNLPPSSKAPFTDPQECQGKVFGCFEVGLPGITQGDSIDDFVKSPKPILDFINLAVNAVIAVLVIIGLITIVIGGYIYMTASGDASRVKVAKEMIIAALAGIFLSLISVIILNTINKYIGSDAQEPKLGAPSGNSTPGGSSGGSGSGGGGSGGGGGLPNNGGGSGGGGGAGGGGNSGIGGNIFNDTPPRSTPQTATIIIDESDYYIRGADGIDTKSSLDEVIAFSQSARGNSNGIKVATYTTGTSRPIAENNLKNGLITSGIPRDAQFISTTFITRKQ